MPRPASIAAIRRQIDRIDDQLLRLLNRAGAHWSLAVAAQKAAPTRAIYAPAREHGVLTRVARQNGGPLDAGARARDLSRDHLGGARPRGALAGRLPRPAGDRGPTSRRGSSSARAAEYVPRRRSRDVFRDVERGRAELGVVPVENSTEGMVAHTLDLLVESPLASAPR